MHTLRMLVSGELWRNAVRHAAREMHARDPQRSEGMLRMLVMIGWLSVADFAEIWGAPW